MKSPCIAVVDDDPAILDMTTLLLAMEGYQPVGFLQAPQSLTCLDGLQPVLVIVDLHLEQLEAGLAVVAALRGDAATAHIPLIVWSADPDVEQIIARHNVEHVMALVKPVLPMDLLALVARLALAAA